MCKNWPGLESTFLTPGWGFVKMTISDGVPLWVFQGGVQTGSKKVSFSPWYWTDADTFFIHRLCYYGFPWGVRNVVYHDSSGGPTWTFLGKKSLWGVSVLNRWEVRIWPGFRWEFEQDLRVELVGKNDGFSWGVFWRALSGGFSRVLKLKPPATSWGKWLPGIGSEKPSVVRGGVCTLWFPSVFMQKTGFRYDRNGKKHKKTRPLTGFFGFFGLFLGRWRTDSLPRRFLTKKNTFFCVFSPIYSPSK